MSDEIFTVKGPTNWWRVAAMAAVPLFLYTTWRYAEAQASLNHIMDDHMPALQQLHQGPGHSAKPASASAQPYLISTSTNK